MQRTCGRAVTVAGLLLATLGAQDARAAQRAPQATTPCPTAPTDGGYCGDGGPVRAAKLADPSDVSAIPGGFLIADSRNSAIRRVRGGTISTAAGIGIPGDAPPPRGRPASVAEFAFSDPRGVAALPDGGFVVADARLRAVLRVTPAGLVRTLRDRRNLLRPVDVAARDADTLLVVDADAGRVFELDLDGRTRPVADGLVNPAQVAPDPATGGIYVTEQRPTGGDVVHITPDGTRRIVAGPGAAGFAGDLKLDRVTGILAQGRAVVVGDSDTVRAVFPNGSVLVLAGMQQVPDATQPMNGVGLVEARGLALGDAGELLIADAGPDQVAVVPGVPQSLADQPDPMASPVQPAFGRKTPAQPLVFAADGRPASGASPPCAEGTLNRAFKALASRNGRIFVNFTGKGSVKVSLVVEGREKTIYRRRPFPASSPRRRALVAGPVKRHGKFYVRVRAPGGCRQTPIKFDV
jgi:hypothetical protein